MPTMRNNFLTSSRQTTYAGRLFVVLSRIALAVVVLQMASPPRLVALDLSSSYQPSEEDCEPTEECESDAEQMLFESFGSETLRNRQPGIRIGARLLANGSSTLAHRPTGPSHAAELLGRNGIGAPLRC